MVRKHRFSARLGISLSLAFLFSACAVVPVPIALQTVSPSTTQQTVQPTLSPTLAPSPSPTLSVVPSATPSVLPTEAPFDYERLKGMTLGFTYSLPHSMWLCEGGRCDPRGLLLTLIQELAPEILRYELYWNWAQDDGPNSLKLDYNLEWQLRYAAQAGIKKVILCLGRKVPHWPEYHIPPWVAKLSEEEQKRYLLAYIEMVVKAYASDTRISHWQLENELYYADGSTFGIGKPFSDQEAFFAQQAEIIRKYDKLNRSIIATVSGDKGDFIKTAKSANILGFTFFSISYDNGGYVEHTYGTPKSDYGTAGMFRAKLAESGLESWDIEHQAETWARESLRDISLEEASKSMNPNRVKRDLTFVMDAGVTTGIFWGAEQWKDLERRGDSSMLNFMKKIFAAAK
ncbi:MAG: hypothetical protein AAB400_04020 [Patescibacteria group bacterium]